MVDDKFVTVRLSTPQYEALKVLGRQKGGVNISTLIRMTLVECLKLPTNGNHEPERYEPGT